MLNALKMNLSVFIFNGKMGKLGMAVMVSEKPGALPWLLLLSVWFSESKMGLCIAESEATHLGELNKQVYLHLYFEFLPLRPMHILTLLFIASTDKMNCNYTSKMFLSSCGCSVGQQALTDWLLTMLLHYYTLINLLGQWSQELE